MNLTFVDIVFALIFWVIGFGTARSVKSSTLSDLEVANKIFASNCTVYSTMILSITKTLKILKLKGSDLNNISEKQFCELVTEDYVLRCENLQNGNTENDDLD
ncbi:hypothetical protein EBU71_08950 [bacterium]|jgi:hypothetical protein|nr:hypothetical protein [Candidatus Elulimicrobium humile]